MQNPIIICTAGHVDHGKTSLLKVLTGIDCDTHPEEKHRGITINLGYAYLKLPTGEYLAFIDVPGHHNFINTMVSGASSVNYSMLIIAANDSVMPQTIEHLKIMELLGINDGLIVITKTDLVDEEMLTMCEEEIKESVKNTFLEESPIFKVSVLNGSGIDILKNHLYNLRKFTEQDHSHEIFRLYIDRVFVAKGIGTIVTGSVKGGKINEGDKVYLFPINKQSKVRQIQKHGAHISEIKKGERCALNIDIDHYCLKPGVMISDLALKKTECVDAEVTLFDHKKLWSLKTGSKVIFLLGTFKTNARIRLLNCNILNKGQKGFIQFFFDESFIPFRGDRFILRSTSDDFTLGGGIVLDPYPLRHVKKSQKLIDYLNRISSLCDEDYILAKVEQSHTPICVSDLEYTLQITENEILELINHKLRAKLFIGECGNKMYLLSAKQKYLIKADFWGLLQKMYESDHDVEYPIESVYKYMRTKQIIISKELVAEFLGNFIIENKLTLTSIGYKCGSTELSKVEQLGNEIQKLLQKNQSILYSRNDLENNFIQGKKLLDQAIAILVKRKILYSDSGLYIFHTFVDAVRPILLKFLYLNQNGISVAQFRDLIKCNRRISIFLFSIFEREKLVHRINDLRIITSEGKKLLF